MGEKGNNNGDVNNGNSNSNCYYYNNSLKIAYDAIPKLIISCQNLSNSIRGEEAVFVVLNHANEWIENVWPNIIVSSKYYNNNNNNNDNDNNNNNTDNRDDEENNYN